MEVDQQTIMVDQMYEAYINSGLAFGAKRWVSSLVRHCTWEATLMAKSCSTLNGGTLIYNLLSPIISFPFFFIKI